MNAAADDYQSFTTSCWEHLLHILYCFILSLSVHFRSYPVNYFTSEQTENFSEIYDLFSLPLVFFYSLPL